MKTYFAKYLPVEGEIKDGDMVKTMGETMRPYQDGKMSSNKRAYQLYKLFLCSRDIQIGEKIRSTKDDVEYICNQGNLAACEIMGVRDTLYKVIGEISPDALSYVKEEDRFDENEINLQWYDDSGVNSPWTNYIAFWDWSELPNKFKRVQIKGPCGHFH